MFSLNKSYRIIEADEADILELYRSSGPVTLELPGYAPQQCQGYLCVTREDDATNVLAALYLQDARDVLVYAPEQQSEERADHARVVREGSDLLTSFGFSLEKVGLSYSKALREVVLRDTRVIRPPDPTRKALRKKAAEAEAKEKRHASEKTFVEKSPSTVLQTRRTLIPVGSLPKPPHSPHVQEVGKQAQIPAESVHQHNAAPEPEITGSDLAETRRLDREMTGNEQAERLTAEKTKAARMLAERAARVLAGRTGLDTGRSHPMDHLKHAKGEGKPHANEAAAKPSLQEVRTGEQKEMERPDTGKAHFERLLAETAEAERLAREKAAIEQSEQERLATEKAEMERLLAETAEAERLAREKSEAEHAELKRQAAERIAAIRAEADRQARERIQAEEEERQRLAVEKAEMERLLAEKSEAERLARLQAALEQAEKERLAAEKAEMERLLAEKAESEHHARLRAAAEQQERERRLAESLAAEKAESERIAREQVELEKAERERLAIERAEIERLLRDKTRAEQEAHEHVASARKDLERLIREKAEMEALLEEKTLAERCGWEQAAIEHEVRIRLEVEKEVTERLLAEKAVNEQQARELAAREQAEKERLLAELQRQSQERASTEQAERERLAAERLEMEQLLAETRVAERLAREMAAEAEAEKLRLEEEIAVRRPPGPDEFKKWKEEKAFAFASPPRFTPSTGPSPEDAGTDPFATQGDDSTFTGFSTSHTPAVIFSYDRTLSSIAYHDPEDIMDIFCCANVTRMAPEGYPMQGCSGYICSLIHPEEIVVTVSLFLTESKQTLIYRPDWQPDSPEGYAQVLQDAIGFLETVGFIVDPFSLSDDPAARQKELDKVPVLKKTG